MKMIIECNEMETNDEMINERNWDDALPNAVKISPPCCLVKLTTRTVGESIDDDGGNTSDVGRGPALHVGTIDMPKWSNKTFTANSKVNA